jgi:hypothetical protein
VAGFENSLKTAALAVLKRDLTERERVEFLELAGAIGMGNVEDYLYMLMVFKRNEDKVNKLIDGFNERMMARFDEMGALEKKIDSTLESSISRVLSDGAREIGRDMGSEIAAAAKDSLREYEQFHYLRGQFAIMGFAVAIALTAYWLGSQFRFDQIDNESFLGYLLKLPSGLVLFLCVFGYAYFWSVLSILLLKAPISSNFAVISSLKPATALFTLSSFRLKTMSM